MPWMETSLMDQRVQFIADYTRALWPVSELCRRYVVSRKTAYKWLTRYDAEGERGLEDRSCRPHRVRRRTPRRLVQRMVRLRHRKKAAWEIADETGVPTSTVSRYLKAEGLGRLWRIEEAEHPPQRYGSCQLECVKYPEKGLSFLKPELRNGAFLQDTSIFIATKARMR